MRTETTIYPRLVFLTLTAALLFALRPSAHAQGTGETDLYDFTFAVGASPGPLTQGSDGNFYGTTQMGGAGSEGTVFKLTPGGVLTTLHDFNVIVDAVSNGDGYHPDGGVIQGSDGNFYGTTEDGGPASAGFGTVYKITPDGVLTILHSFNYSGGRTPQAGLVQGSDGNFYGTTSSGGANDYGTIFSITPSGVFTSLHDFTGSDGAEPLAALIQGSDGNFYGTTSSGGETGNNGFGTIFSITPAGVFSMLYTFGADYIGLTPKTALVQGDNGNFYGTTANGGMYGGNGTIFSITPGGTLSVLYSFDGNDGGSAQRLIQGSDGNFYGTASGSAVPNGFEHGSVFRLTPSGTLTILYHFTDGSDGSDPEAGLIQASNGDLYGTTDGGVTSFGTAFQLNIADALANVIPKINLVAGGDGRAQYGAETGKVVFRRTGDTSVPVTVYYKVKGSAKTGVDFKTLTGILTIPAGAAQAKVKLKPLSNPKNTGKLKAKFVLLPAGDGSYVAGDTTVAKITVIGGE